MADVVFLAGVKYTRKRLPLMNGMSGNVLGVRRVGLGFLFHYIYLSFRHRILGAKIQLLEKVPDFPSTNVRIID